MLSGDRLLYNKVENTTIDFSYPYINKLDVEMAQPSISRLLIRRKRMLTLRADDEHKKQDQDKMGNAPTILNCNTEC